MTDISESKSEQHYRSANVQNECIQCRAYSVHKIKSSFHVDFWRFFSARVCLMKFNIFKKKSLDL